MRTGTGAMRRGSLLPTAVYLRAGALVVMWNCAGATSDTQDRDMSRSPSAIAWKAGPRGAASIPLVEGAHHTGASAASAAPEFASPRRSLGFALRLLWKTDTTSVAEASVHPFDIHFSDRGLLVMDVGDSRLNLLDSRTGTTLARAGGEGAGPNELRGVVTVFGTRTRPMLLEFQSGRVAELGGGNAALIPVSASRAKVWTSGCAWGDGRLLLNKIGPTPFEYFVSTIGRDPEIVDSLAMPWPRLLAQAFIARQARLRQVDDSTCAILPAYYPEFALLSPSRPIVTGRHIEELPAAVGVDTKVGNATEHTVARGAKHGHRDARAWRDAVIILFEGTSEHKGRVLDVFSRKDLLYRGSMLLPFEGGKIAISGDTLAVVGEENFYPVVAAFLLVPDDRQ